MLFSGASSRLLLLASLGFPVAAFAQQDAAQQDAVASVASTRCEELPEMHQALCWMVVACGALAEENRREECYRVAADSLQHPGSPGSEPSPVADGPQEQAEAPVAASVVPAPAAPAAVAPPSQVTAKRVMQEVLDIPRRFSAQVTARRKLVRNRLLLVLDGTLLFETDNADTAGIDPGDEVDVVKASSLRGRNYQIVGPSKRAVTGLRIRCERLDLSASNRRKCAMLPGRNATAN